MPKKIFFSYKELHEYTNILINKIKKSWFKPDIIVSIAMWGLLLWYFLKKSLWIKNFEILNVNSYSKLEQWKINDNSSQKINFSWKKILLVDDLVDSWKTIDFIITKYLQNSDVKITTRFHKKHSIIKPDFFVKSFSDERIVFPYEIYE